MNVIYEGRYNSIISIISIFLSGHAKEVKDSLFVEQISFEETGLNTAFTYRYQQILQQQLSDNSNYALQKSKSDYSKMLVRGTYWDKGEYLEIKTELYNTITKNTEGSYKTKLYKSKIEAGLEYISSDISKLEGIKDLVIKASNTQLKGQVGFDVKEDLKLTITDKSGKRIAGVPVKFVDEDNKIEYGVASSNNSGTVVFHINRLKSGNKSQTITAKLDLDTYLTIDKENSYVQNVLKFTSLPASKFYLTVKPSQIYFKVNERNFGVRLGVPVIESGLKDQLSDAGYSFIEDRNKSDLIVTINADTRKGGEVSGIYFSYVDITVSVAQRASGKEVFKKSFNNYKASGSSFEHAGGKAYQVAKKEVCNQVIELMAK